MDRVVDFLQVWFIYWNFFYLLKDEPHLNKKNVYLGLLAEGLQLENKHTTVGQNHFIGGKHTFWGGGNILKKIKN